jgi:glutamate N-acetyltransferase/amino-acid N-acetyltransferase
MSGMNRLPQGFIGAGLSAGIKASGNPDLALIVNTGPSRFASAVFTSNRVSAAPVIWSKQVVVDQRVDAVVLNSGGANACTGPEGFLDTHKTAEKVAEALGISASDVVVCSTGLIGERLPMEKIISGIDQAVRQLSPDAGLDCATAIMTTDSRPKIFSQESNGIRIFGMAKGAGMLAPSLATMLSVIAIDAKVGPRADAIFKDVVSRTYNRIDSDGCTSTNDTVLFMASGSSGIDIADSDLESLLIACASSLSQELIADAEGHSKIVKITTINAASEQDAVEVGRSCARNNLLKCALHGEDPNWGRVLAAIGTTSAEFDPLTIDVSLNGVMVCQNSAPGEDRSQVSMRNKEIEIVIDLKAGNEAATIWTNDLTAMYVHENSAYSS